MRQRERASGAGAFVPNAASSHDFDLHTITFCGSMPLTIRRDVFCIVPMNQANRNQKTNGFFNEYLIVTIV